MPYASQEKEVMIPFKTKPWNHQYELISMLSIRPQPYFAYFWDMGTGKTKQGVDTLRLACFRENRLLKTLIICPVAVMDNWQKEIIMHSNLPEKAIAVIDGATNAKGYTVKNPQKKYKIAQLQRKDASIFIISKETVGAQDVWEEVRKLGIEFLLVDESHNFKAHNGKRTKSLMMFSRQPQLKYRYILTGTPVLQNALDLWSQFYIMNPKILGDNYFTFRAKYFYDENASNPYLNHPNWIPKDEAFFNRLRKEYGATEDKIFTQSMDYLNNVIYKHAHRIMKSEALDLPERTEVIHKVPMTKEHSVMYHDFHKNLVTFFRGETKDVKAEIIKNLESIDTEAIENLPSVMRADLAIVKTLRLLQLTNGIFTDTEGNTTTFKTAKDTYLKELLQELLINPENKIIIWNIFRPRYKVIEEIFNEVNAELKHKSKPALFINGLMTKAQKDEAQRLFQTDKDYRVIIVNQAAGGTGVNLTAANYEIEDTRGFKLGDWLQADSRAYRGGQKRNTTKIALVMKSTIETGVIEKLIEKRQHADDILTMKEFSKKDILDII